MTKTKGYWIGRVDVLDAEAYGRYRTLNAVAFEKFGARFLVRGPVGKLVKGGARKHNVVIEFDDYAQALACYESPEYQAAKVHLDQGVEADIVIVEGYPG
ncbi:MAG: DUF1330 domain-containing protein [Proteobacteria bacterium]|nr:DUF1330 domain-containing protein [Pseudomonadota bacterium]